VIVNVTPGALVRPKKSTRWLIGADTKLSV
jgi:hypothetical protein